MGIVELRQQQKQLESWQTFGERLLQGLPASLSGIEGRLAQRTGLRLYCRQEDAWTHVTSTGVSISDRRILSIVVSGVSAEVVVEALSCSITGGPTGYCYTFYRPGRDDEESYSISIDRSTPSVPVRIRCGEWSHDLWWMGPADTRKFEDAIVDGLEGKERRSEFSIARPEESSGGNWIVGIVALVVLALLILWANM